MKRILVMSAFLLASAAGWCTDALKFNSEGEFKVVQFTDLHFVAGKPQSRIALKRMEEVIISEKPDLIVITGDIIYSSPASKALDKVLDLLSSCGIPFCTVFGNHDADCGLSRGELYDLIRSRPGCIMPDRGGADSPDYTVEILSGDGKKVSTVLYLMDSNAHLYVDGAFRGYDRIHDSQLMWYRSVSDSYRNDNGGVPVPSVAFFHIPLPEFSTAVTEGAPFIGTRLEAVCSPVDGSGMFSYIKAQGDIFAVFVGHDHDNDYAVSYNDVLLAYGRYTGGNTEYNNLPNGARVIVLKEGRRALDSYVVIKGGVRVNPFTFPDSFQQTSWWDRPLDGECR